MVTTGSHITITVHLTHLRGDDPVTYSVLQLISPNSVVTTGSHITITVHLTHLIGDDRVTYSLFQFISATSVVTTRSHIHCIVYTVQLTHLSGDVPVTYLLSQISSTTRSVSEIRSPSSHTTLSQSGSFSSPSQTGHILAQPGHVSYFTITD